MNSVSEVPLLTARPVALAEPGYRAVKASAVTAARTPAPEPGRAQGAEQRLRKNRPEEGPPRIGPGAPGAEFTFGDFLDLINPLQHIPIVGTIYRAITGDEIGGPAKIMGGLLFGGPIGFIASIFDTIVSQATGHAVGETVLAALIDRDKAPEVQVTDAQDLEEIFAQGIAPSQYGEPEDTPPTPDGAPGPVSGRLDPFGLVRGVAAPISVTPVAAGASVVAVKVVSVGALKSGNQRLVPSIATTDRGFAERMLEALDKYQAQTIERTRDSRATRRLDLAL